MLEDFPNCRKLIDAYRKLFRIPNKTPLSVLYEYASRLNFEVSSNTHNLALSNGVSLSVERDMMAKLPWEEFCMSLALISLTLRRLILQTKAASACTPFHSHSGTVQFLGYTGCIAPKIQIPVALMFCRGYSMHTIMMVHESLTC